MLIFFLLCCFFFVMNIRGIFIALRFYKVGDVVMFFHFKNRIIFQVVQEIERTLKIKKNSKLEVTGLRRKKIAFIHTHSRIAGNVGCSTPRSPSLSSPLCCSNIEKKQQTNEKN